LRESARHSRLDPLEDPRILTLFVLFPSYPFVDDSFESANVPKVPVVRPDPVALAGDPSLNPDAKLLLGELNSRAFTSSR